jgi:sec-independent protein translocase protein TatA
MPNIGPLEIVVVLIIALVVFGPKRLPELGKSMGRGIREFRSTISGKDDDDPKAELDAPADGAAERVDGKVVGHSTP